MVQELLYQNWMGYSVKEFIQKGGNGTVKSGTRKSDGKPVALKSIPCENILIYKEVSPGRRVPLEVYWLYKVGCIPGCIKMVEYFTRSAGCVIIMERPTSCVDLWEYATNVCKDGVPEAEARVFFRQCLLTLDELYKAGIVHNDVKPENLLLDREAREVKLIDFGCAAAVQEEGFTEYHGTVEYMSPEFILNKSFDGLPFTVWSLGITLFYLIHADLPFTTDEQILAAKPDFRQEVSEELRDLIETLLHPDPSKRPDFSMILAHPWLQPTAEEEAAECSTSCLGA